MEFQKEEALFSSDEITRDIAFNDLQDDSEYDDESEDDYYAEAFMFEKKTAEHAKIDMN